MSDQASTAAVSATLAQNGPQAILPGSTRFSNPIAAAVQSGNARTNELRYCSLTSAVKRVGRNWLKQ